MDGTQKPISADGSDVDAVAGEAATDKGFFGSLVQSIFEPGANNAVVLAMNVSFFLLLIVLFGLAFLTNWDFHVLMMLVVSTLLWASMIWFVMELQKTTNRPDNMPPDHLDPAATGGDETGAEVIPETRKDK